MTCATSFTFASHRQVENSVLAGCVSKPATRPDEITGQDPFQLWKDTRQDRFDHHPAKQRGADDHRPFKYQRAHVTPRCLDSGSLPGSNHSSETAL